MREMRKEDIAGFGQYLSEEEKSTATTEKYLRDIKAFYQWLNEESIPDPVKRGITKNIVLSYKEALTKRYAVSSVNSILSSLNAFFCYMEWHELRVKIIKVQKQLFSPKEKELTKAEYERLLTAAKEKKNNRLYLLMQTICATGLRVSELRFVTVESLQKEYAQVNNKGKRRTVYLPHELCKILKEYCREENRKSGAVFVTKNGNPPDRSNIWSDMKKLCQAAGVSEKKVFPHNLRHLFARTYYSIQKDVVRLADILGHSNVNTTRIYTMESGEIHQKQIQRLGLFRCQKGVTT